MSSPNHASVAKVVVAAKATPSEIKATMRRSCRSAIAPAGIAMSITGSPRAAWTSATLSAEDDTSRSPEDDVSVMAHATPTPCTRLAYICDQARNPDAAECAVPQRGGNAIGVCGIEGVCKLECVRLRTPVLGRSCEAIRSRREVVQ